MLTESSKRAKKPTLQAEIATPNVRHLHRTLILHSRGSVYICAVCMQCVCISVYIWMHIHIIGIWEIKISDIITREIESWNSFTKKKPPKTNKKNQLYCRNGNRVVPRTWIPFYSLPFLLSLLSFRQTRFPSFFVSGKSPTSLWALCHHRAWNPDNTLSPFWCPVTWPFQVLTWLP